MHAELQRAPRWQLLLAFAAVYLIWGSTYLAIRFAIESLPPLTMAGARFATAGAILYAWARARGVPAPGAAQWGPAAVVGALLLLGGNGGVVTAQQRVPSGIAALLIATVALWMALLEWLRGESKRPTLRVALGLVCGMAGVGLLVGGRGNAATRSVDPVGAGILVLAAFSWALGSLHSRRANLPRSPILATSMQMLTGGALLMLAGLVRGEWAAFDPSAVSQRSVVALVYLLVFGSLIGFTSYMWLLHHTTAARAATYAFVNPLVAVFLGWVIADETLTPRMLVAAGVIIAGVVLIVTSRVARAASIRMPTVISPEVAPIETGLDPTTATRPDPSRIALDQT